MRYFHALVRVPRWDSDTSRQLAKAGVDETYDQDPSEPSSDTPTDVRLKVSASSELDARAMFARAFRAARLDAQIISPVG
jgi:hypothetical protein